MHFDIVIEGKKIEKHIPKFLFKVKKKFERGEAFHLLVVCYEELDHVTH
jgi:hypothetical protein